MASANTTVLREEIHLLIKKPESNSSTSSTSKRYPTARCRPCTSKGKQGVNTRWICDTCGIGLCSRSCFESFHSDQGFEILSAARKVNIQGAPDQPQEPLVHQSPVLHEVSTREQPGFAAWRLRAEGIHTLCIKPPTEKKPAPTLACSECRYQDDKRVERRTICKQCRKGFCSINCLRKNHFR